jgi:hypothetical protein
MLRKQLEIPPEAAQAFVRDMRAFFKASGHKADEIAAEAGWRLKQHLPRGTKLRISSVIRRDLRYLSQTNVDASSKIPNAFCA